MVCILVTGASGLIGQYVCPALANAGHDVVAVGRTVPKKEILGVRWIACDLLDQSEHEKMIAEAKPTHLLHLAWVTDHGYFWGAPENKEWLEASKHLIEAFSCAGGERVVVSGSCAEYDWTRLDNGICREGQTPLKPHTLYGQSKLEFWRWLEIFASTQDLSAAWGRMFFTYGKGEPANKLISSVAAALKNGNEAKCSSGVQLRDFMHANDIGLAFAALLQSNVVGEVNVGSGEKHSIGEVVRMLGEIAGQPQLVRLGAMEDRPDDPPSIVADVTRLRDEVGFTPSMDLHEGLQRAYEEVAIVD